MAQDDSHIKKLYYSIGEVSQQTGLKQYVLRYWETEFPVLRPQKNRAGNRVYRQKDVDTVLKIKDLLYNQKYTIEGARRQLRRARTGSPVSVPRTDDETHENRYKELLKNIKGELEEILRILSRQ